MCSEVWNQLIQRERLSVLQLLFQGPASLYTHPAGEGSDLAPRSGLPSLPWPIIGNFAEHFFKQMAKAEGGGILCSGRDVVEHTAKKGMTDVSLWGLQGDRSSY